MMEDVVIGRFLEELGSCHGTPGSGALACLVAAGSGALAQMHGALSLKNPAYSDNAQELQQLLKLFSDYQASMLDCAKEDEDNYEQVLRCYQLPKDTEERRSARSRAMASAMEGACLAPLRMLAEGQQFLEAVELLCQVGNPAIMADSAQAALLVEACARGSYLNVLQNTAKLKDREKKVRLCREAQGYLEAIQASTKDISERTRQWIEGA